MRIALLIVGISIIPVSLFAADFAGTWKLDPSRSKLSPNGKLAAETMKIIETAPKVYRFVFDVTSKTGKKQHVETVRYEDGREHPMEGVNNPAGYSEITRRSSEGLALQITDKKDGKTMDEIQHKLSPDGKMLTSHQKGVNAQGKPFDLVLVFERQ